MTTGVASAAPLFVLRSLRVREALFLSMFVLVPALVIAFIPPMARL
jgi:hypothetical protein